MGRLGKLKMRKGRGLQQRCGRHAPEHCSNATIDDAFRDGALIRDILRFYFPAQFQLPPAK